MINKAEDYVRQQNMIKPGDHVIVGVSGGADSVCLLFVLIELQKRIGFSLSVVHIEHGIRGEASRRDADFVAELAERIGISYAVRAYDVPQIAKETGTSVEEAARNVRYKTFAEESERIAERNGLDLKQIKIAVAHHREDLAETVLFHMCRGSGLQGLSGIAPVRGQIIRPLLDVSRKEIETYLTQIGQRYCTDATNADTEYTRNYIRHELLPHLQKVNEQAVLHISQIASEAAETERYLEKQTLKVFWKVISDTEDGFCIHVKKMEEYPCFLQKRICKRALEYAAGNRKDLTREHVELLFDLLHGTTGRTIYLPYQLMAVSEYERIRIFHQKKESTERSFDAFSEKLAERQEGQQIRTPYGTVFCQILSDWQKDNKIPKKKYTKWLDYDKITVRLAFRFRMTGDYLTLDDAGHTKKLKDYFINEKVPRMMREKTVLAADGSHIIWAVGYRVSAYYKVTEDTKRVIKIQWMEENDE